MHLARDLVLLLHHADYCSLVGQYLVPKAQLQGQITLGLLVNGIVCSHLNEARAMNSFDLTKVNFCKIEVYLLTAHRWRWLEVKIQAEMQLIELSLRHELSLTNQHVAIELFWHAKLIVKSILYVLKAWLHRDGKRFNNQTIKVRVIIMDNSGRSTACSC